MHFLQEKEQDLILFGLTCMICSLSFSNLFISLSQFFVLGIWVLAGQLGLKFKQFFKHPVFPFVSIPFLVYLLGIFYSHNISKGLSEFTLKLPLITLPVFLSFYAIKKQHFFFLLKAFLASLVFTSLFSVIHFYVWNYEHIEIRNMSFFISHIRFGLFITMGIIICIYFVFYTPQTLKQKIVWMLIGLWLLAYLFISQNLTGLIILGVLLAIIILKNSFNKALSIPFRVVLLSLIIIPSFLFFSVVYSELVLFTDLASKNPPFINSPSYFNDTNNTQVENGHYIWRNIQWAELEKEWNKKSDAAFSQYDQYGNLPHATLIRYLSSKNLNKDSVGMSQLTPNDIIAIEQGTTNYRFPKKNSLHKRIYETLWELDAYFKQVTAANGSIAQRLEFWKTALKVIQKNPYYGAGAGDLKPAMDKYYQSSLLSEYPQKWLKPHNQYLTWLVMFGSIGFSIIILSMIYVIYNSAYLKRSFLGISFLCIIFLSMFTEDTLDTQVGISFYALFLCLFIARDKSHPEALEGSI